MRKKSRGFSSSKSKHSGNISSIAKKNTHVCIFVCYVVCDPGTPRVGPWPHRCLPQTGDSFKYLLIQAGQTKGGPGRVCSTCPPGIWKAGLSADTFSGPEQGQGREGQGCHQAYPAEGLTPQLAVKARRGAFAYVTFFLA